MRLLKTIFLSLFTSLVSGQINISGTVLGYNNDRKEILLSDVNIVWLNSTIGTSTNSAGEFSIPFKKEYGKIVISYVGYQSDTIVANRPNLGKIWLRPDKELEEVTVRKKLNPIQKSLFNIQNVVTVDSREMLKAACCNLSESFETNPTVDVNISDAITGAKQIQMLGLNSPYLLFTQENMPSIRGASQIYGLSFIPGSWIESIQITKGSGSVLNGFESISGQINSELVKPLSDKKLFFNTYANNYERYEVNTRYNYKFSENLGTGIYLHANLRNGSIDKNSDSFLDTPLSRQINFMNRWQFLDPEKGWVSFFNVQYLLDDKQTGQEDFSPKRDKFTNNYWGSEVNTDRFDVSAKLGYVFPELPYQSFGFQTAYSNHDQNSYYGFNLYDIQHKSFYSNFLFNSIIGSTQHKFKTGLSFNYDSFYETVNAENYDRNDNSVGVFFEYTYDNLEKLSFVAGIRMDSHNRLNTFITPRLHLRYALWKQSSLRFSIGRGKRAADIFAENQQLFASSRKINLLHNTGNVYSLKPEVAWNSGIGFIQKLFIANRAFDFSVDFNRIVFIDQVLIDWENPREVSFYNLKGKSFSNSLQIDLNYEIIQNLDIRATYKNNNVKLDYNSGSMTKPLQSNHRFFVNLNYETFKKYRERHWRMDLTVNWQGKQRLPNTSKNPPPYRLPKFSEAYSIVNSQLTRVLNEKFEIYLGGENITNTTQKNSILATEDPFGPYFDSTLLYKPVLGHTYYLGLRYKL
ncbi:Outer membrane receptor proteins, mostly Fe transport [Arenibacter nanhaiticus]|uniref:Outer membrane receptor proteins, mostly Fe transport n=1 Tax=Arenibacter nanhaiticus TaxID=558155 RepID=A0A1M6NAF0_9FLAO|nr:TonB-dependent receptor [Arenibacter nanhaiticus]SHJ92720.1 Outer membrane receptor proteins, mostly Fe transport [Arenibacter nanhaiticus]